MPLNRAIAYLMIIANISLPQSVNETTDLLLNDALTLPVGAVSPAAAAGSSEAVSSEAESLLPLVSQPVRPTAASGAAHSSSSAGH